MHLYVMHTLDKSGNRSLVILLSSNITEYLQVMEMQSPQYVATGPRVHYLFAADNGMPASLKNCVQEPFDRQRTC